MDCPVPTAQTFTSRADADATVREGGLRAVVAANSFARLPRELR